MKLIDRLVTCMLLCGLLICIGIAVEGTCQANLGMVYHENYAAICQQ